MRAALYGRVSTGNGDQDPEVQLDELRTWAQRLGYEVTATYIDRLSGAKGEEERPAHILEYHRSRSVNSRSPG